MFNSGLGPLSGRQAEVLGQVYSFMFSVRVPRGEKDAALIEEAAAIFRERGATLGSIHLRRCITLAEEARSRQ
jgi:hypothetical protein